MFVRFHFVSKEPVIERAVGEKTRTTANDLINANFQINTSYLVYFVRRPSLINALCLIDAFLTITVLQKEAKSLNYSVFLLVCKALRISYIQCQDCQGRLTMATQYNKGRGF